MILSSTSRLKRQGALQSCYGQVQGSSGETGYDPKVRIIRGCFVCKDKQLSEKRTKIQGCCNAHSPERREEELKGAEKLQSFIL